MTALATTVRCTTTPVNAAMLSTSAPRERENDRAHSRPVKTRLTSKSLDVQGLCGAGTQDNEGRSPATSASGTERGVETRIGVGTWLAAGATEQPRCSILVTKGDVIARTSAP